MAITASGLTCITFRDALDTSAIGLDLLLDTHKLALFDNTITPNFSTDTAYGAAPYDAGGVSGTGWAAAGVALSAAATGPASTNPTWVVSSGSLKYDMDDVSVAGTTLTAARGALLYAEALAGNNAICLINFGADYSTVAGIFGITWNAAGVFTIDLTP